MNDELMHYGVPGMQWGKHKALSRDISIGRKDNKRFHRYSNSRTKRLNKQAVKIFDSVKQENDKKYEYYKAKTEKAERKNSKKASTYREKQNIHKSISEQMTVKINSINDGTLKAGRDFIIKHKGIRVPVIKISPMGGLRPGTIRLAGNSYVIERKRGN